MADRSNIPPKPGHLSDVLARHSSGSAARRIVQTMSARGAISAAEIAQETGLARSTVSTVLADLRDSDIVVSAEPQDHGRRSAGRPAQPVTLNPQAGTAVGIHLGMQEVRIAILDLAHRVLAETTIPLTRDYMPADAALRAFSTVSEIYRAQGLSMERMLGVGVAVSGPVSPDGIILHSSILPRWSGQNVRAIFEPVFRRPIYPDNESNCAAIAEMTWGEARGAPDFVLFKIDVGVGGAIVQGGRVVSGAAGGGGEFGHMCIDPNGLRCRCGNIGCLETIASFQGPLEILSSSHGRPVTMHEAITLAQDGDSEATAQIEATAERAAWGLSVVGTILNPPLIIIGGYVALAGEILMSPLLRAYEKHVMIKSQTLPAEQRTRITFGSFVHDDSLRGAAGLVLREVQGIAARHGG